MIEFWPDWSISKFSPYKLVLVYCRLCAKFDTLVWNLALRKAQTFNWSGRGFENFWWCWTSFTIWWVSNIHMFMFNLWIPVANTKSMIIWFSRSRSRMFETHQILLAYFLPQKRPVIVSAHDHTSIMFQYYWENDSTRIIQYDLKLYQIFRFKQGLSMKIEWKYDSILSSCGF